MSLIICILAGGASSRFGQSKLNVTIDGKPLLAWHRERLAELEPDAWWVSLGPDQAEPAGSEKYDKVIRDASAHNGPLHGIASLAMAAEPEDALLVVPADMPIPSMDLLQVLGNCLNLSAEQAAVMAKWGLGERAGEVEPFPSIWRAGPTVQMLQKAIHEGLGGPRQVAAWPPVGKTYLYDDGDEIVNQFANINEPADMAKLEAIIGKPVCVADAAGD